MRATIPRLLLLLTLTSCGRDPLATDDGVSVRLEPTRIVAVNESNTTYFYALINPRALMSWTTCASPSCPRLEPGDSVSFGINELVGGPDSPSADDVALYYWRLARKGDGYEVVGMRSARP